MSQGAILVTGATGFLGGALVRHLKRQGAHVIAAGRNRQTLAQFEASGIQTLAWDMAGASPGTSFNLDSIVHCAALSSPWGRRTDFENANIAGTRAALKLAGQAGVRRFVHISTPSVYFRFADQDGLTEDTRLPAPVNHYARTKRAAEGLVLAALHLDPIMLRPRAIYGRGDTTLLPRMIEAAARRPLPLMRDGRAATDMTHVDDVVSAMLAALAVPANPAYRIFNISGGAPLLLSDVITRACESAGIVPRWRELPFPAVYAFARLAEAAARWRPAAGEPPITAYTAGILAFRQTLDISRARKILGWVPKVSFEEGVARTFPGEGH